MLRTILEEHKLQVEQRYNAATSDWLLSRVQNYLLKLQALRSEYLSQTYTHSTVPALQRIRGILAEAVEQTQTKFELTSQQLLEYKNVSTGFSELANEYRSLLAQIKERQWALSELRKDDQHSEEV